MLVLGQHVRGEAGAQRINAKAIKQVREITSCSRAQYEFHSYVYNVNKKKLLNIHYMNARNRLCYGKKFMNGSRELDFGSFGLEIESIIFAEATKTYKLMNIVIMATKRNIYSKRNV